MKGFVFTVCLFASIISWAQQSGAEIQQLRDQHLQELKDTSFHILNPEEIARFQGLDYFDFNPDFQIQGHFTLDIGKKFKMPTSTERLPVYRRYGYVDFVVNGDSCRLEVYQNMALRKQEEYKDYLFIPFRDLTSGESTYGGGRYLDTRIPATSALLLDFNLCYNPYCAYSHRYSCPIPPEVNFLKVLLSAGEKTPISH